MRLEGEDITRLADATSARACGIGYVPQGREIFPGSRSCDNLRFAAAAKGGAEPDALERVLAEFPRLQPLLTRPGGALSRRRAAAPGAGPLPVQAPRLLLLDEPTEGIQPSIIEEIVERLRRCATGAA